MTWNSIETLQSDRLVLLIFAGTTDGRWIGYVDEDGICEWPDEVRGHRPTGWQEVIADLSWIMAVRFGGGL